MHIVLGVTGGIAAYKAAEIIRSLRRAGSDVSVIMTAHAQEFITPLTLQTLSGREVITGQFDRLPPGGDVEHISIVRESDLLLVAPATADIIAKFARGVADDFLSTFYTAYTGPVLLAPAMNSRMWGHPGVDDNLGILRGRGVGIVDPESGDLACGEEGVGRLASTDRIVTEAMRLASRGTSMAGERVLVTAGPTREPIDPVRYISNRSSGKMGYAIASAARRRGATVTLVAGPTALGPPWGVEVVPVETAAEMADEVGRRFESCTMCIMAAAVSDYRPLRAGRAKIRRKESSGDDASLTIDLTATEDILSGLAARKGERILIGFAAQTGDPEPEARRKLKAKGLDYIFGNDVTRPGAGFDIDTNIMIGLARGGKRKDLPLAGKAEQAERILDWVLETSGRERPSHPSPADRKSAIVKPSPGKGATGAAGKQPRATGAAGKQPRGTGASRKKPRATAGRSARRRRT